MSDGDESDDAADAPEEEPDAGEESTEEAPAEDASAEDEADEQEMDEQETEETDQGAPLEEEPAAEEQTDEEPVDEEPTDEEPADEEPADGAQTEDESAEDVAAEEPTEAEEPAEAEEASEAVADEDEPTDLSPEDLETRLEGAEEDLEAAETEADLDAVEAELDAIESALESADLPEPDDEDEEGPREELESRLEDVRGDLEEARGPYAEDVIADLESARETLTGAEWTDDGEAEALAAVDSFLEDAGEQLDATFARDGDDVEAGAAALDEVAEAVGAAGLDPDDDEKTIAALLEATDELQSGLDDAEEWDDLTVVEQLTAQGFYDRLTPENRKDFPPEQGVVRIAKQENDPERVLMALEYLESDFMEENCLDALARMGPPEALDAMLERAKKRDQQAIDVLGRIGDPEALDTLHEFIEGEGNPPLQKVTLQAIGQIGSEESTQAVADRLVAEDSEVRSQAARALGRIGDPRAVDPLSDLLADDDDDPVRASAAWALVRIGTREALEEAAEYSDERSFVVQQEAERAAEALDADATPA